MVDIGEDDDDELMMEDDDSDWPIFKKFKNNYY